MINVHSQQPVSSRRFVTDQTVAAQVTGVYAVFFDSGNLLLEKSHYLDFSNNFPICVDGYDLLYVGTSAVPLRPRILAHLTGNSKGSSLRMTVGSILLDELLLDPVSGRNGSYFDFGFDGEQRLTDWMLDNTRVAAYPARNPLQAERELLISHTLPFNINERRRHPYSKYLMRLRAYLAGRPASTVARGPFPPSGEWHTASVDGQFVSTP